MLTKHCLQEFILDCQLRRLSPRTVKGYPTMYLDGYTPYEILQATSRKMYNDHLERQEEAIIPRSTQQLCEIIERIREKRLRLVIVGSITLDCRDGQADPMSEAFLQMAGVFSQLELAMIRARVRSGMANAAAKGAKIGRPQVTADNLPATFLRHYPAF